MGGIARSSSRAAATDTIHRVAPCAVAPPGPFTSRSDELCSSMRLVSRSVCCSRLTSPSAVCTAAADHRRTRPSRCPSPASIHPCTSHTASYGMPQAIAGGGSSPGTAASCICYFLWRHHAVRCRQRMEGITRSSSRAAATVAIRRAAPCAVAPPSTFAPVTVAPRPLPQRTAPQLVHQQQSLAMPPLPYSNSSRSWAAGKAPCSPCDRPGSCSA